MHPDSETASQIARRQLPSDDDQIGAFPVPDGFEPVEPEGTEPQKDVLEMWDGRGPGEGITGLADFSTHSMYISPRSLDHHNGLFWRIVKHKGYAPDPLWAWNWGTFPQYDDEGNITGSKGEGVIPHSGGGVFQARKRYEDEHGIEVKDLSRGIYTEPADLFVVAWVMKRLDVPGRTWIKFDHADPRIEGESVHRQMYLRDVYQEMRFADVLPEPAYDRGLDVEG